MALVDDKPRIIAALKTLSGVKEVLPEWPKAKAKLPCITVTEATNRPAGFRDDREYMTELEYYVRVFAINSDERSRIASDADDQMQALGYTRTMTYEQETGEARQKLMRYRRFFGTR